MHTLVTSLLALALCLFPLNPALAESRFKTFEVVEVTETSIILEDSGGKTVEIEKKRRPYLKKGDRVRYDKARNRLGKTLEE